MDRTEKASAQIASHDYYGSARHVSGYEELAEGPGRGWKSVSPGNLTNLELLFFCHPSWDFHAATCKKEDLGKFVSFSLDRILATGSVANFLLHEMKMGVNLLL